MGLLIRIAFLFMIVMFIKKLFLSSGPSEKKKVSKRFDSNGKDIKDADFKEMDRD